jgi:hypothetical protein
LEGRRLKGATKQQGLLFSLMIRAEAVEYLSLTFSTIAAKLGIPATDTPQGYAYIIDSSLEVLGVSSQEEPESDALYKAALDYFALRAFWRQTATLVDTNIDGVPINRSQFAKNLKDMMDEAATVAGAAGIDVGTGSALEMGRLNLDFLEPAPEW